jgi:hypothetical protein
MDSTFIAQFETRPLRRSTRAGAGGGGNVGLLDSHIHTAIDAYSRLPTASSPAPRTP